MAACGGGHVGQVARGEQAGRRVGQVAAEVDGLGDGGAPRRACRQPTRRRRWAQQDDAFDGVGLAVSLQPEEAVGTEHHSLGHGLRGGAMVDAVDVG
jgi:hypothetical protein